MVILPKAATHFQELLNSTDLLKVARLLILPIQRFGGATCPLAAYKGQKCSREPSRIASDRGRKRPLPIYREASEPVLHTNKNKPFGRRQVHRRICLSQRYLSHVVYAPSPKGKNGVAQALADFLDRFCYVNNRPLPASKQSIHSACLQFYLDV